MCRWRLQLHVRSGRNVPLSALYRALRLRMVMQCALLLGAQLAAPARAQPRPNVVLILADDLGWGDVGADGQLRILTPNIDRLAVQGMRFTQAYATAPVCAPSRCGLLTGFHGGHCAVQRNTTPNAPLRLDDATLGELLQGAGYATAVIGKWGLGGELADGTPFNDQSAPWNRGFATSYVYLDQALAHDYYAPWLWRDGVKETIAANALGARGAYTHDLFTSEALEFVDTHAADTEPFFLYLAYTIPHREVVVPSDAPYSAETWPPVERAFAAMITRMDTDVGLLLERLADNGLDGQTLVLFASDNGPHQGDGHLASFFDSNGPYRGNKRDLYEGGIRSPLLARWPGVVPAGTTTTRPVSLADLLPTLADLAGVSTPPGIDGRSIAATLRALPGDSEHEVLYWSFDEDVAGPGETPARSAIRRGDWKLIVKADGARELYDLAVDPGETNDVSALQVEIVRELGAAASAEATGPPEAATPVLAVRGDAISDALPTPTRRPPAPVLWLRFDDDRGATTGSAATMVYDTLRAPGNDANASPGATYASSFGASVPQTGTANVLGLALDPLRPGYVTIPHHPSFSFGAASSTFEAWIRLDERASDTAAGERQWLAVKKTLGRGDEHLDYGLLVQAGDLAATGRGTGSTPTATGREMAIAFGDGSATADGLYVVVSRLRLDDGDWHHVSFAHDVERQAVRFGVDGTFDDVAYASLGHLENTGPLFVGAHPTASGAFNQGIDGALDELRITRGVLPPEALLNGALRKAPEARTVTLDFGELPVGAPSVTRTFTVWNAARGYASLLAGRVDGRALSDARLSADVGAFDHLAANASSREMRLTFDPRTAGALDGQTLHVEGVVMPYGHLAVGSPLTIHIVGRAGPNPVDAGAGHDLGRLAASPGGKCGCSAPGAGRRHLLERSSLVLLALYLLARQRRLRERSLAR